MKKSTQTLLLCACGTLLFAGCDKAPKTTPEPGAPGVAQKDAQVEDLDDTNFTAQTAKGVVLVDFWAPWCGPCRTQGPIVETAAKLLGEKAKVAKVNVDTAPKTAQAFKVQSIPTLIVFKDGKPVKQFVGVTQADALVAAATGAL